MYKTILIPIDVTHIDAGKAMIPIALSHATAGTRIILLNVVEEIPEWAAHDLPSGLVEKSRQNSSTELEAIAATADVAMEVQVHIGHAYQTILDVADRERADLIIVASHRPGFQDYFLGSTAAKVVRHATCSVLVVR
jgi:nucleotide-binding universal stress UspA family protein